MEEIIKNVFSDGVLCSGIACEIDHHTARRLRERIDRDLFRYNPSLLVLDFSKVRFMDSSGIGLIIGRAQTAGGMSCSVRVIGLSPSLYKLVRLTGLEKMKNITVAPPTAV